MKRNNRYDRLLIILLISVVSISGMALINSPIRGNEYLRKLGLTITFNELIEKTLSSSFENSLIEVNVNKAEFPFNQTIDKSYTIDNTLIDFGLIYHVKLDDKFNDQKALRKMLEVLSRKYIRIRREIVHENINGDLISTEENGYVYDASKRFAYINRIITYQNEAWILILTFNDQSKEKVKDLLNSIWIEKEKGLS